MEALSQFLKAWAAHGQDLHASGKIEYDQFLIIATDESFNLASGCSIDSSVHFVQDLGSRYSIDFFDRSKLAFLQEESVNLIALNSLKGSIEQQVVKPDSLFFQNTVQTKGELKSNWLVKAGESWLKRYFKTYVSV